MAPKKHYGRRIMASIFVVIVFFAYIEVIALIWLYFSVDNNKTFWKTKSYEQGELTYLALGDSAAQGIGATSPMRGYVGLIAKNLEAKTGKKVRIINLSVSGATVRECIRDQLPLARGIKADYVTIEIGANDVKNFNANSFKKDISVLVPALPDNTYISNLPLFNSRPNSTEPAKKASVIIEELVQKDKRLHFVDLQKVTEENQSIFGFAPDLFHPNNLSYRNWFIAFWTKINSN